jgi:hypothetical protein
MIRKTKNVQPYISILKDTMKAYYSIFKDQVASGAIEGLRKLSDSEDKDILSDIIDFLIYDNDFISNMNRIRQTTTTALGDFQ